MNNQMNSAVRKIHNLLSSGAVTVTGPNQPRILKQKVGATTVTATNNLSQMGGGANRCYVCDDSLSAIQAQHPLTEMQTSHTATKFPNKIGQLVGDAFMVIVSVEDVVCSRCTNLLNYLDRLENDVERVRANLMNLLHKKYGLNDEGGGSNTSPPTKLQKLNSGTATRAAEADTSDVNRTRKLLHTPSDPLGKQSPPVSAVQQLKIATQATGQQNSAGTQTLQRKTTKIYKCLACDYKTSDMRLFNTHYETCKQQNFQCKNCKKIFPNFGAMKQHMVREHNTPMDNTCAVCHINFVNEAALRKHMEMNHSTNVVVTSTTTLPAQAVESITSGGNSTPLYTCNHCQFKSTDKTLFDEHLRKHLSGVKPKPFKCRLCAQRFETREAATVHAKQHQPNYFKCGTCSMSFPKRELLVKHFEVHQQPAVKAEPATPVVQQQVKQQSSASNMLTTQKLLQETIDEALSDSVNTANAATTAANEVSGNVNASANNIRFFSCHICSLTFIQENYYNQHMETHRRDKKSSSGSTTAVSGAPTTATNSSTSSLSAHNSISSAAAALLSDDMAVSSPDKDAVTTAKQASAGATSAGILEADIESIFEKMHSDKSDGAAADGAVTSNSNSANESLVITSQAGSGGITFNITIPQPEGEHDNESTKATSAGAAAPVNVSIDMPMLDQPDEAAHDIKDEEKQDNSANVEKSSGGNTKTTAAAPVSMPSLDDDNDTQEDDTQHSTQSQDAAANAEAQKTDGHTDEAADEHIKEESEEKKNAANEANESAEDAHATGEGEAAEGAAGDGEQQQHVSMELDEAMQAQVESGQIKFILNENGQLLQLDNHIITDADGNQILVQDPEQIQQLLQSVGVLQSGDGLDGETLQMMTDSNGQMVLVQGENNETQLIDASLLNADGQLVIQQGQDGELGEGAHVIGEDGTRIPVSVSYTADGQPIVQVQQQVLDGSGESGGDAQHDVLDKDGSAGGEGVSSAHGDGDGTDNEGTAATGETAGAGSGSGGFFGLDELMHQSSEAKTAE